MERAELIELLTPAGLALLDSVSAAEPRSDVVGAVTALRKEGHSASLVSAVLTQARLRHRAVGKFGDFASRMLFTEAGLEQATRLRVAALHAGRFTAAGIRHVADLGCGLGGDALAMAAIDLEVTAVEADEVTATLASYNLAPFEHARVIHGRAEDTALDGIDAAFLDPARRTAGHGNTSRLTRPEDYTPSLDFVFSLAERMPIGVKLGPGLDRDLIPDNCEAQWVSVDGQLVEMGLWFGPLARAGVRRSALVLDGAGPTEITGEGDSEDAEVGELGEYIYEPDGSVIRARLIGTLARSLNARMLSADIAWLTSDAAVPTRFAAGFRVLKRLPLDERTLRAELGSRGIGTLEIKKRGVDIDPAEFRKKLKPSGPNSATLVLTRVAGRRVALLTERLP